jgi:hypothetical protein
MARRRLTEVLTALWCENRNNACHAITEDGHTQRVNVQDFRRRMSLQIGAGGSSMSDSFSSRSPCTFTYGELDSWTDSLSIRGFFMATVHLVAVFFVRFTQAP